MRENSIVLLCLMALRSLAAMIQECLRFIPDSSPASDTLLRGSDPGP
jgi:hypothetical protein